MADKSNPFRAALDEALAEIGVCWKRRFRSGRHADVYSWEDRWLALIVQKTISPKPWWNIPHYFEPLRVLERQHPSYLVIEVCQDEPEAGTVLEGAELERLFVGGTSDGFGNVKVFPEDLREGTYLRGADRMADFIWELLRERPPEPGLSPDMLIPTPRRRASHHKSAWMRALFAEEESPA